MNDLLWSSASLASCITEVLEFYSAFPMVEVIVPLLLYYLCGVKYKVVFMFVLNFVGALDLICFLIFYFAMDHFHSAMDHLADLTVKYVDPSLPIISKCSYPNFMYVI